LHRIITAQNAAAAVERNELKPGRGDEISNFTFLYPFCRSEFACRLSRFKRVIFPLDNPVQSGIVPGMLNTDTIQVTQELLALLSEIDEFKGACRSLGSVAPERLSALRRVATIESIGSSTRLEGSGLTDREWWNACSATWRLSASALGGLTKPIEPPRSTRAENLPAPFPAQTYPAMAISGRHQTAKVQIADATPKPGGVSPAINRRQSGPCGPAILAPSRTATNRPGIP
jgi:hypothetical protein